METVFMEVYKCLDFTIQSCIAFMILYPDDTTIPNQYPKIADQVHELSHAIDEFLIMETSFKNKINDTLDQQALNDLLSHTHPSQLLKTAVHFIWSNVCSTSTASDNQK